MAEPTVAAFHLRHAFELALLQRLTPGHWIAPSGLALALLACRAAALYYRLSSEAERAACGPHLPAWLTEAFEVLAEERPSMLPAETLAKLTGSLSALQAETAGPGAPDALDRPVLEELRGLLARVEELAVPSEHLLVGGGDTRLSVDPATGLNVYGCSPEPRPEAISFASCTASTISGPAYDAVERLRQGLISAALLADLDAACQGEIARVKQDLLGACGAMDLGGTEVILTASGTDTEFCALHFALCDSERPIVNVVIAPDETGSGVIHAAQGRHFGDRTPAGTAVELGAPLAGFAEGRVRLATVAARDGQGALKPGGALAREVEAVVEEVIAGGARCLLHLLDSAKTGWRAPDIEAVRRLCKRHGADLDVVVDACQMRAGPEALRGYLDRGFMVQVTGSKFCMGPPFSGALILPPAIAARHRDLAPLAAGLADYATRPEWPRGWDRICRRLPDRPNLGLLCRWTAALGERRAFDAVPEDQRYGILARFGQAVQAAIAGKPMLELVPGQAAETGGISAEESWDRLPTISSFTVRRAETGSGQTVMGYEETKTLYRWLNMDLSGRLPEEASEREREIAATPCHIGQPVKLCLDGAWTGALRLCAGARLVSRVSFDASLGDAPAVRLDRQIEDAGLVLDKVALMVKYWDALTAAAARHT
jgi:hypothetical protein